MPEEKIFEVAPGERYQENRSRFTVFFEVFARKFWKLISVNLTYMLFNIPAVIIGYLLSVLMIGLFIPTAVETFENELKTVIFISTFPMVFFFMAVPSLSVGPAQAGLTYILRCFSYELPTFNWSDFKDKMKENLKQGFIVSGINLFILLFLIFDLYLYSNISTNRNFLMSMANGFLIVVFVLFLMMSLYIYPMMVSYSLKTKDLYKNALIFALVRFIPNLIVLIICFILIVGPIFLVQLTASETILSISYVFYILLGFTLPGLVINFFVNPVIDKYLKKAADNRAEQTK